MADQTFVGWPVAAPFEAAPGTLEHFLTERYCLYTVAEGGIWRAEIHHPPWQLRHAEAEFRVNAIAPAGLLLPGEPLLHFAERQDVVIWPLGSVEAWRSRKPIAGQKARMFPSRRLDVYLNDHLAGAMGGIELCRRALRENSGSDLGAFLEGFLAEVVEDRRALEEVAARLGSDRSPFKPAAVWALEKAGRLKLNGQLRGYSPLSRLIELEGLQSGVSAKRSLWQALQAAFRDDPRLRGVDLDALIERADRQLTGIETQRLAAAGDALSK
jgi:hypothetical protein